jgi:hypothetical protein
MKIASTKVTNPEWKALLDKCNGRGTTIAEYLRQKIVEISNYSIKVIHNFGKPEEDVNSTPTKQIVRYGAGHDLMFACCYYLSNKN